MKLRFAPLLLLLSVISFSCFPCNTVDLATKPLETKNSTIPLETKDTASVTKDLFVPYDTPPDLVGGFDFVRQTLRYPERARQNCLQAKVIFAVVISENGEPISIEPMTDDQGWGFNEAGIECMKKSKWRPALGHGKPVKVRIQIPINFKLR